MRYRRPAGGSVRRRSLSGSLSRFGASVFRRSIGTTGASLFGRVWGIKKPRFDPHAARAIHARFPRLPNRVIGSPGRRGRRRGRASRRGLGEAFFLAPFTTHISSPDRAGGGRKTGRENLVEAASRDAGEEAVEGSPPFKTHTPSGARCRVGRGVTGKNLVAHLTRPAGERPALQKPNFGHPAARLFFQTADGEQKGYFEARDSANSSWSEKEAQFPVFECLPTLSGKTASSSLADG